MKEGVFLVQKAFPEGNYLPERPNIKRGKSEDYREKSRCVCLDCPRAVGNIKNELHDKFFLKFCYLFG